MNRFPALSLACSFAVITTAVFTPPASARTTSDLRAGIEYATLPGAVGSGRRNEAWFSLEAGTKWKSSAIEGLRLEALFAGEWLVLSPSTSTANSQTLGSPQAGEWNKSGSPHYFEDRDLFIEYRKGSLRSAIGSKTLRWGVADFYDPLDQINSRRMERPAQSTKRGEWMVFSEFAAAESAIAIEAFVIPLKRGSILPSQTSPWLPRQLYVPNRPDAEFILPEALEYRYREREDPDSALRWNAGARLLWRPQESEISVQYDEGAAGFPSIRAAISGPLIGFRADGRKVIQADPLVRLAEVYYRERHYGGSFVRPIAGSLLRFQFGKTEPMQSGRDLANDRSDFTLAVERQFGLGSWGSVTLLAQGFKNALEDQTGGTDIASFSKFFDRAAALGLRFSPRETTTFTIGVLSSLTPKGGTIFQSSLTFDLTANVNTEIAWTMYEANLDSPIGPFKDNDGGSIKLTASF